MKTAEEREYWLTTHRERDISRRGALIVNHSASEKC